jgi:hypothetical protein
MTLNLLTEMLQRRSEGVKLGQIVAKDLVSVKQIEACHELPGTSADV